MSSCFIEAGTRHGGLPKQLANQCQETDQATAALIQDLKLRGLLDETLIVWGGEFGRTVYCQGELTAASYGRDHHPALFDDLDGRWRRQARRFVGRDGRLQL